MCEYCRGILSHDYRCPNYSPPKAVHYCSICEEGIYDEDKYIENLDDEFAHYECIDGVNELLNFLGCDIKTWRDY